MYRRTAPFVFAAAVALGLNWLRADEVIFKNGNQLTGKIESFDGQKLTVSGTPAGTVSIELKNVKTFSTAGEINIVLNDGTVIHQKILPGPDGQIALPPSATTRRDIPLGNIKLINPPPLKWTGNIVLGGTLTRGNTDTDDFNASFHAQRKSEKNLITVDAGYVYGRQHIPNDGNHETQNNWFTEGKEEYSLGKKFYGYGDIRAEQDVIAQLALRLTAGAGMGYRWVDTPKWKFGTEAGVSWLHRSYSNDGTNDNASLRAAYHLTGRVNDKVSIFHNFEYFPALNRIDNYYFNTDAGIRTDLTKNFFTQFKVEYRYDSRPAPGRGPNDVRYILGVGWSF